MESYLNEFFLKLKMEFCPKCGSLVIGKACSRCDYKSASEKKLKTSEKVDARKEIVVIDESKDTSTHPIVEEKCSKCKNNKSYFWEIQTRASDESPTKFFKCTKCGHTKRDYR